MPDTRQIAFCAITAIVLIGTTYSVANNTFLDTSDPLLAHLPHPLSKTHYYARKGNWLNVYFIKLAWGWTSAAFLFSWLTSPPSIRSGSRMLKWAVETLLWLAFCSWFFGPALIERVIVASGGECILPVPSGDHISLPYEYCYTKTTISSDTHPQFFTSLVAPPHWEGVPRLRRGHDVSGHIFLLTMGTLFLADQLRPSFTVTKWSLAHTVAVTLNGALIVLWLFATFTTSLYFHTPFEKLTGYFLGLITFGISQIPGLS